MINENYEVVTCSECGVLIIAKPHFFHARRRDHNTYHCLNGHKQYFPGETEEERLRKRCNAISEERDRLEYDYKCAEGSRRAEKAAKTKLRKKLDQCLEIQKEQDNEID